MTDIATIFDAANQRFDWQMGAVDLASDSTLRTAIIVSLFTDRVADADDALPDPRETDRRGWWGDEPLASQAGADARQYRIGSKLWLRARMPATVATAALMREDCKEALQWMIDDGVCAAIEVTTTWISRTALGILIATTRVLSGVTTNEVYNLVWTNTFATITA